MPATRRKAGAATINGRAAPRWSRPKRQIEDRSRGKTSSADIAIEETTKSQPRSVKDICKLRNSDAHFPAAHRTMANAEQQPQTLTCRRQIAPHTAYPSWGTGHLVILFPPRSAIS